MSPIVRLGSTIIIGLFVIEKTVIVGNAQECHSIRFIVNVFEVVLKDKAEGEGESKDKDEDDTVGEGRWNECNNVGAETL